MASAFDLETVNVSEIVESITGVIFAPVILPVAIAVKQPSVQSAIKGGIALSQRCQEAVAETVEVFEDLAAEVSSERIQQKQAQSDLTTTQALSSNSKFEVSKDLIHLISDVNADISRITSGVVDLRLLLPLGLSALAVQRLLDKGLQLEEIPWYTLAWYAFDSFTKLNEE